MRPGEAELARLEAELADLLEEKQMNMARPMRGVVRDAVAVARKVKAGKRAAHVVVMDTRTNKLVIKVDG